MKIFLTGAGGNLGQVIEPYLLLSGHNVLSCDIKPRSNRQITLDLTDPVQTQAALNQYKPELVLHLAGIKDVFECERNPGLAYQVNYEATKTIADFCKTTDTRMLFISSDYVFDGKHGPFSEDTPCNPTTQYGRHKLLSENYICQHLRKYAVIRSAGVFGTQNDFVSLVLKSIRAKQPFKAFDNLVNTPTFINDLNQMFDIIISQELNGLFHCVGSEIISRYEFAKNITRVFGGNTSLITPQALNYSSDPRPPRLDVTGLKTFEKLGYYPKKLGKTMEINRNIWTY